MYSESMKNIANVSAPRKNVTMFAPVSVCRRLKMPSGMSGAFERCSVTRNSTMRTAEAARTPIVFADDQPFEFACVSA